MMNRQFEYTEAMSGLRFTDEQKAAIAARAAQTARQQTQPRRSRRHIGRTAVIAACLVVVLTATAGATGVLQSAVEVLSPLFGGSPAQTEIIDQIGYPIGASDTDNGVTVTAEAVMGDAYNAVVVYTISRDDGTALLPEGTAGDMLLVHGNGTDLNVLGGTHGGSHFVVEDPASSSIQLVDMLSSDVPINDCTATGTFENIYNDIINIGKIFRVEERAEELVAQLREREASVEASVAGLEPVRVFYFDSDTGGGVDMSTVGDTGLQSLMLEMAGAENIFSDVEGQFVAVSWEDVVDRDPEYIIVCDYYGEGYAEEKIAELKANPATMDMDAVVNDRFIVVPGMAMFPSLECMDAVELIAAGLRPDEAA